MKKGVKISECYNQQKLAQGQGEDINEHTKTTQARQYNSTEQDTNSTRVPTKISLIVCLIQTRLGTYICQKDRCVLKTF